MQTLDILSRSDEEVGAVLESHGLVMVADEARRLCDLLGREPTAVEAHLFNTMWSEHCSYKSSRPILKEYLPTDGPRVVLGPVEDAGIVRVAEHGGRTWCLVIGHESHNHPSQVVPYEGAATGVGGILRDVYCMGAEVFGVLDPLRFGDPNGPSGPRVREIARGVVDGIWGYGNAVGVPNLGGDAVFHESFDDNCLVNVVAVGIVAEDAITRSRVPARAKEEPYVFVLVGKPTDDSGFGGAAFASIVLDEEDVDTNRGAVQAPDPFLKRVLAVAIRETLEFFRERDIPIGFKDLGAGGIACVTSELAHAGGFGAELDLDLVPLGIAELAPEIIACSETQERFCFAVPASMADEVLRIFNERFELPLIYEGARAAVIGDVVNNQVYKVMHRGDVVCETAVDHVTEGVTYRRPEAERERPELGSRPWIGDLDIGETLKALLGSVNGSSRRPIYRHYDTEVQGNSVLRPGEADAAVVQPVRGAPFGIAVSADGNPGHGLIDPWAAGANAVVEAVRNVAAVGARALCLTDCLNYGNPEQPEVMYDFREGVRGVADAARGIGMFDDDPSVEGTPIPIVSGNVSFYNQSAAGRSVAPSPIVACAGWLPDASKAVGTELDEPGNHLVLIGARTNELGGSLLEASGQNFEGTAIPPLDFEQVAAEVRVMVEAVEQGLARSAHDISSGGVLMAACEMLFSSGDFSDQKGLDLDLRPAPMDGEVDTAALFFGEAGGFLIETHAADELLERCKTRGVRAAVIGRVTDTGVLRWVEEAGEQEESVPHLRALWQEGLETILA